MRGMQRFISEVIWDEEQMRWNSHHLVAEEMGDPEGVLMFDETGRVKKGADSVGVARQYCGTLGKVDNCQVGVFAAYASRRGYALVDKRLFLPEVWWTDASAARRTKCKVPDELTLQSKPQLAASMLQAIAHEGLLHSSILWRIASMGIVQTSWTPSMRVSASQRWWRSLRKRTAGSRRPRPQTRRLRTRAQCAQSAWCGAPSPSALSGGGLGGAPTRFPLVSADGLGRNEGSHGVCLCPPTRDTLERGPAGAHRLGS